MIIYNVTVSVENDIADAWQQWMKTEHMPDVMSTGLFVDCRLCRLLQQDETEGLTYAAQYFCDSLEEYNAYIDNHAEAKRNEMIKLFVGKFVAFRTIMEVI